MNRRLALNDASLPYSANRPGMFFNEVYPLDKQAVIFNMGEAYLTLLPPVLTGNDEYRITFSNLHCVVKIGLVALWSQMK